MASERDYNYINSISAVGGRLQCYRRMGAVSDVVELEIKPFLLSDFLDVPHAEEICKLTGNNPLCYKAVFADCAGYELAADELKKHEGVRLFRDYTQMAYLDAGIRLFGGMEFSDLRRMQISCVTDDKGLPVELAVAGGSGEYPEESCSGTPQQMVEFFVAQTLLRDPDVIEGHKLNSVTLPALERAAKKAKLTLAFGRSGRAAEFRSSRFSSAEKVVSFRRCDVDGRHLIDTEHLAVMSDSRSRDLDSYELDYLAGFYGFSGSACDITRRLADMWEPSYFYCTKLLPMSLQDSVLRGTGSSLELLMISEYLKRHASIPFPQAGRSYPGALSRADRTGVFRNVRHCDVRSLYPSIISGCDLAPESDEQRVFPTLLRNFLDFRIKAKELSRTAPTELERRHASQLQSACKIVVNSFYGYLGFAQGSFNDYTLAEKATATGKEILLKMADRLEKEGALVIEMDTDGIYFVPPQNITSDELERRVRSELPAWIVLEFDSDYQAMFSYKSKNYALLDGENKVKLTGSALRSRALEPFQRKYIAGVCRELLAGTPENISLLYDELHRSIADGTIPLRDLTKSEVLSDSTANYKRKLESGTGRRSAAYEAAIASGLNLKAGETVRFYVTGNKKKVSVSDNCRLYTPESTERDENREYYCSKLAELAENFRIYQEKKS